MEKPTSGGEAAPSLDPALLLAGVNIPATTADVFAMDLDGWRSAVLDLVALSMNWPSNYASAADLDSDGSVAIDSGIGFFAAVALLTALGADAIPADFIRRDRLTSIDRVAHLLLETSDRHEPEA